MKELNKRYTYLSSVLIALVFIAGAFTQGVIAKKGRGGGGGGGGVGCSPAAVSITPTSPYANQKFAPGDKFYTDGVVYYTSCDNSTTQVYITVAGPSGESYQDTSLVVGPFGGHGWRGNNGSFHIGAFKAPEKAGTYYLNYSVHSQAGICGSDAVAKVPIIVEEKSQMNGGGCGNDQFYCELFRQCIPQNQKCNVANPNYVPAAINPNIPAKLGPVKLKNLTIIPPIGVPGYSCKIDWSQAFDSYSPDTHCTFVGPSVEIPFDPSATTSPTYYQSGALSKDTVYKVLCHEAGDTVNQVTSSTCRLNWNYKEVN